MMTKNLALLTIGAAIIESMLLFDVGHAVQIDRKQAASSLMVAEVNRTAQAPTIQLSNTPTLCTEDGMSRPEAPCPKHNLPGSRGKTLDKILYTIAGITVTLVMTLVALILWVVMSRRIQMQLFVKGTH